MRRRSPTRDANARNNASQQRLRLDRWSDVRDAAWAVLEPLLAATPGARVLVVGAGNGDDLPVRRIAGACGELVLCDIDPVALERACARIDGAERARVRTMEADVTDGAADAVLRAARAAWFRTPRVAPPQDALAGGGFDVVVGDMLYTQLLHPGLIALGIPHPVQRRLMRRYDPVIAGALVDRLHASAHPAGHVVHLHDVACWARAHAQPVPVEVVLHDPDASFDALRRHDACDPHVILQQRGASIERVEWWRWQFEPDTAYVVRCTVARALDVNRIG